MAVINPHQETHPGNQNSPSNDNSPGHPANQQYPSTPEGTETESDSTSSSSSSSSDSSSSSSSSSSDSSSSSSSSDAAARRRRRRRREQEQQAAVAAAQQATDQNTETKDESVVNPHAATSDTTPVAESAGTSGDEEQGDGERRPDEEEEGPSQAEGPTQVEDTSVGELSIPTWGGVLLRNGKVVGSVGPLSQGTGDVQADSEKAGQLMTEQSQLFAAEIQSTADTPAAESERLTGLAAQMRTIAEHWRDSGHDEGWQDQEGNAITASAHYVSLAESIEATAEQNHQIAQQNADERASVEQRNADAQDAVTRFDGAEASALSRLQDGTATAADYAHVADTYAQLQETWQEDTGNNLVQIPVAGSVQPLNPEAYFERQERLYRRIAGDASKNEEAARVAATPATQLEDPEGGVAPPPSPRVVYNRVTAGGEFVQESTAGSTEYVNDATGEQVGYQTERGDIAINRRLIPEPSKVYPTVTRGGEYVQESTAPGAQYAYPGDRVVAWETPSGLVSIRPGAFDPPPTPPPDDTIQVATPHPVPNPDDTIQVATPQPVPNPDDTIQVATPQPVTSLEDPVQVATPQPVTSLEPTVPATTPMPVSNPDATVPVAPPQPVTSLETPAPVATPMPVSEPDPPPPPPPPRQEPSLVDLALSSYSPLGGKQATQDFAASPAEMALAVVPVEDQAAWIKDHGLSPPGTLVDKIQDPTQSPAWYDFALAALDVIGGVGAPVPGGMIARAGRLVAVPTRIVPVAVDTTVDVAKVIAKPVVRHINTERSVMTRMEQLWRQGVPYETAVKQARLEAQRIRPSQVDPTLQGQVSVMPPGSAPPLVGTTNNPNMILTMYSTPHGPVVAPAWYPWKNQPLTGSGGGPGGGTTPPGGTYRTQSGLLLDSSGNVVTEGAHPTSVAAQAYDATAQAIWSAATTPATAQVVPATTSGVISRVATTSTASAATPVLATTPAQQSDVAPEVTPTKTTTLTPSVQFGPTVVTQPVPDTSTRFNAEAEIQTPPVSLSTGVRQGVSIVPSYGATHMAATSSARLFAADPVEAKAPTSRLQQSEPIDTPVTRVSTPASATITTTGTTADPVVTQTVQPQPALGAVSTGSSTDLGPVTTQIDHPPTRLPKKGRLKNRSNNTPQHQEDPGSVQESKAGGHPHVSRWETRTVHQLDHRTGNHTSEVVDDTNVRTFQVVERGAESTSGKKWRANHLEVTSDQGKAVPAAVRFLRRPAEANATSTSEPKASKFSGLRAKAQQGARAVRTGATQGAQAARTGAVEARARFSAAGTRLQQANQAAQPRMEQARTKFADYQGKARQVKGELDQMLAKMQTQPPAGGQGSGRKKSSAKGKQPANRSKRPSVKVTVQLVQPGGGTGRGSGGTNKALARRLASGR